MRLVYDKYREAWEASDGDAVLAAISTWKLSQPLTSLDALMNEDIPLLLSAFMLHYRLHPLCIPSRDNVELLLACHETATGSFHSKTMRYLELPNGVACNMLLRESDLTGPEFVKILTEPIYEDYVCQLVEESRKSAVIGFPQLKTVIFRRILSVQSVRRSSGLSSLVAWKTN